MPSYPGMGKFQGTIQHTHECREANMFAGKNVVVIGAGNSALDLAVDISLSAKQVT